jgi:hypothetical protein
MMHFISPPGQEDLTQSFQREIYTENEYNRFGIKIEPGDIVLDCGANVGIFSQYAFDMGAKEVYSYECDEPHFKCLTQNITHPNFKPTLGFVSHGYYNLSTILTQHNLQKINFAKIDIEGAEWEFFLKMNDQDLIKVDKWAIEFHTSFFNLGYNDNFKLNKLWDFLKIFEKFSINNYNIYFEHIHKGWDIVMLYAKKNEL